MNFLTEFWFPEVGRENSLLELGCNCGVNLEKLQRRGYKLLSGVETSLAAIEIFEQNYPGLFANTSVYTGSFEEVLPGLPTDSVDVVFTMAVAMHIHPASNSLFAEMVRVAKSYVCTVELETANNTYVFARSYERVFERLGARQIRSVILDRSTDPPVATENYGYIARLFSVGQ